MDAVSIQLVVTFQDVEQLGAFLARLGTGDPLPAGVEMAVEPIAAEQPKAKRGRPRKKPPEEKASEAPVVPGLTKGDVRDALQVYASKRKTKDDPQGFGAVTDLLRLFRAERVSDLKPERYPDVIAKAQ